MEATYAFLASRPQSRHWGNPASGPRNTLAYASCHRSSLRRRVNVHESTVCCQVRHSRSDSSSRAATLLSPLSAVATMASAAPTIGISFIILSKQTVNGKDCWRRRATSRIRARSVAPDGTPTRRVFGIVKSGTLTRDVGDSSIEGVGTIPANPIAPRARPAPTAAAHQPARDLGTAPVVLEVAYVDPAQRPDSRRRPRPRLRLQLTQLGYRPARATHDTSGRPGTPRQKCPMVQPRCR